MRLNMPIYLKCTKYLKQIIALMNHSKNFEQYIIYLLVFSEDQWMLLKEFLRNFREANSILFSDGKNSSNKNTKLSSFSICAKGANKCTYFFLFSIKLF